MYNNKICQSYSVYTVQVYEPHNYVHLMVNRIQYYVIQQGINFL